jgi:hypothetical protein
MDQPTLIRIARSRGIGVSQAQQLKPGVSNPLLIKKIVADFSPDELSEVADRALQDSRFGGHNFKDLSDENLRTLALQRFFPDVQPPLSHLRRLAIAVGGKK